MSTTIRTDEETKEFIDHLKATYDEIQTQEDALRFMKECSEKEITQDQVFLQKKLREKWAEIKSIIPEENLTPDEENYVDYLFHGAIMKTITTRREKRMEGKVPLNFDLRFLEMFVAEDRDISRIVSKAGNNGNDIPIVQAVIDEVKERDDI